mmetsp:Transcript_16116/g.21304  ORF Transcript_16116/g.21304 Transcript_16116/m.21304 type:complete len:544 (+) Transcript_16116:84-1715(+)
MGDEQLKLNRLESFLDKGGSPQALPMGNESELVGWSPHETKGKKSLDQGMSELSLGPAASSENENKDHGKLEVTSENGSSEQGADGAKKNPKELTKAERRALFEKEQGNQKKFPKKEKLSKAERRALQEKQRAEKESRKQQAQQKGGSEAPKTNSEKQPRNQNNPKKQTNKQKQRTESCEQISEETDKTDKTVELFAHLPQYVPASAVSKGLASKASIHPSVHALGLKYAKGEIRGSNGRCIAMLNSFKDFILDYKTPQDKALSWDLDKKLRPQIQFLIDCRPHSISMGNAIKFVRNAIAKIPPEMQENDAKDSLCETIDTFIQERIVFAGKVIAEYAETKVVDGDVILTYGRSEHQSNVVEELLLACAKKGKKFRVIVVDSRPHLEGKATIKRLSKHGIPSTYILLSSLGYVISDVTKVFIGAAALLSNGAVGARVGTANVAMTAHYYKKPVMVCCETYKFCDKVSLDSICSNELGNPDTLATSEVLKDWINVPNLKILNLLFDLTPIEYVSMVITEVGMIPPTSAPVLLREYRKEFEGVAV